MLLSLHLGQYSHLLTAMYLLKPCNTIKAALNTSPAFPTAYFHPISFLCHTYLFLMLVNSLSPIASLFKSANFSQKVSYSSPFFCMGMARTLIKTFLLEVAINDTTFCFFSWNTNCLIASYHGNSTGKRLKEPFLRVQTAHVMPVAKTLLKINPLNQKILSKERKIHFSFCNICNYSDQISQ